MVRPYDYPPSLDLDWHVLMITPEVVLIPDPGTHGRLALIVTCMHSKLLAVTCMHSELTHRTN